MGGALSIQTSQQGPPGAPGPAGAGVSEPHGSVHPTSPDVGTDAGHASNNKFIDLTVAARVDVLLRVTVGGLDLFGVVGDDPTALVGDESFMLRSDGVRVWFHDELLVDNTDPIIVTIPPVAAP